MSYTFPTPEEIEGFQKSAGRPTLYDVLSPQEVRAIADQMERKRLSEHARHVIDLLGHGGVMSDEQLGFLVAASTLEDYASVEKLILEKLPFTPSELTVAFQAHGLPCGNEPRLYVLSQVGLELAERRLEMKPISGHLSYRLERILHDVIVNEIVLRLYRLAIAHSWRVSLSGTSDGALYNADFSHKILEPDALITLKKPDGEPSLFCIEYHNEDKRTRAERKVDRYENVRLNNAAIWQEAWEIETFPRVLAIFSKPIVGEGYRDKLKANPVGTQFYGKSLDGVLQDNLAEWVNMKSGQREAILA
jgi:hypothetical protein